MVSDTHSFSNSSNIRVLLIVAALNGCLTPLGTMPTVCLNGPYRFYFYSSDGDEPLHIHVQRDQAVAKFWLNPIRYEHSIGFRPVEIRRIQGII
jgi:hypothetical protein